MRLARITSAMVWLCLLACGVACGDESTAAPPASGGKGGRGATMQPPPVRDAGGGKDDEDGGGTGDPVFGECTEVKVAPFGETVTEDYFNSIGSPMDFAVTRVVGTWDRGCKPATIKIVMSDGDCPNGGGHELTFLLDADDLLEGENTILPEPDGTVVRVRYTRPGDVEPAGTWGTCTGSTGMFSIKGPYDSTDPENIQAMFQFDLTKCDGTSAADIQIVTGRLNVDMRRTRTDVCPDPMR